MWSAILAVITFIVKILVIGLGEMAVGVFFIFKDRNTLGTALLVLNPLSLIALPFTLIG